MQALIASLGITGQLVLVHEGKNDKGSIYISNFISASQENLLQQCKIGSILTVAKGFRLKHGQELVPFYCFIGAEDKKTYEINKHFPRCFQFIDKSRKNTNILIHCKAGVSRSATIIIAYLMHEYKLNLMQAYNKVKQAHSKIKPNLGFINQLIDFNREQGHQQTRYNIKENHFQLVKVGDHIRSKENQNNIQAQVEQQKQNRSKMIETLRQDQHKIGTRIKQIKSMIQQNSTRNRTMSEYLKAKLIQFRKEVVICQA